MARLNLNLRGTGESPSRLGEVWGWAALAALVAVTLWANPPGRPPRAPLSPATTVCVPSPTATAGGSR